jgi:GH25 family lysozyme M1 (1,4-beta-N-acetylmuramidase)
MWQKSSTGHIDGISGNVDLDECYQDYPEIIQGRGLNGFPKPETIHLDEITAVGSGTVTLNGKNYAVTLTALD